jgi:regulation of enolase protein 1 (concanavalin A-like superfamily)
MFSFLPSCYSSYGAWTFTPVGLAPTDHASLRWTHTFQESSLVDTFKAQNINNLICFPVVCGLDESSLGVMACALLRSPMCG